MNRRATRAFAFLSLLVTSATHLTTSNAFGSFLLWDESVNGDLNSTVLPPLQLGVNEIRGEVQSFVPDFRDDAQFEIPSGMIFEKFLIADLPDIDFRGPSMSINSGPLGSSTTLEFINTASFQTLPLDLLQFDSAPGPQPSGTYNFDIIKVVDASGKYVLQIVTAQSTPSNAIPEPTTFAVWSVLGLAISGGCWWRRRRSK